MTVKIQFKSRIDAERNKAKLINEVNSCNFATWGHRTVNGIDIIYHNADQYIHEPSKNVLFRIDVVGNYIVFSTAYWEDNPQPSSDMYALHTGRLVEMLLKSNCSAMIVNK